MLLQIVFGVVVNGERNSGCIRSSKGTILPIQNLMTFNEVQFVNELACHSSDLVV